jgi:hypothetical protein
MFLTRSQSSKESCSINNNLLACFSVNSCPSVTSLDPISDIGLIFVHFWRHWNDSLTIIPKIIFHAGSKKINLCLAQSKFNGRHDTQHNDLQLKDTQHKGPNLYVALSIGDTQHNNALPLHWVSRFIYDYAECIMLSAVERFCLLVLWARQSAVLILYSKEIKVWLIPTHYKYSL